MGGLAFLLQRGERGAGRQWQYIFSGRQEVLMLQTLAAGVPRVQQMWSRVAWIDLDARWAVVISARVTLYGGQEPATSTFSLRGCNLRRAGAGSGGGAFGSEWGRPSSAGTQGRHARTRCSLRNGFLAGVTPISRRQCYPLWVCNST